jgi:hypothetical protein
MDIQQASASDLTDSVGASKILTERFGRSFGIDSVHQLVKQNKIRSFLFQDGSLIERMPDASSRGKDLIFLRTDLEAIEQPKRPGRPAQQ